MSNLHSKTRQSTRVDAVSGLQYTKSESQERKHSLSSSHFEFVQSNKHSLAEVSIPYDVEKQSENMAALGPHDHIAVVRHNMQSFREDAEALWGETLRIREQLHSDVQVVHAATLKRTDSSKPDGIHIALIEHTLRKLEYWDTHSLIADLKQGFPIVGKIPVSTRASPGMVRTISVSEQDVVNRKHEICRRVSHSLVKADSGSSLMQEVNRQTIEDIQLGRMTPAVAFDPDHSHVAPTKRFAIEQQSSSGKSKIRIIDDFAESMINELCEVEGHIRMGKILDLVQATRTIVEHSEEHHSVYIQKADFKSAYRNCPINPEHSRFAKVVYRDSNTNTLMESTHKAMPFGAVAAVYAWDRLGEAVAFAVSNLLVLPVSRYVDDLFTPVYTLYGEEIRSYILEIGALFGVVMDEAKTPVPSSEDTILGILVSIQVSIRRLQKKVTIRTQVDPRKAAFWGTQITQALEAGVMSHILAQKLAGRLNFAASASVGGCGNARLRHLYRQSFGTFKSISSELANELKWWLYRLDNPKPTLFPVGPLPERVVSVYSDAEGGGGVGAVLATPTKTLWFRGTIDSSKLGLEPRDTQIIPLEALAQLVALRVWHSELGGCKLLMFIDNQSALGAIRKGRSDKEDIHQIVTHLVDLMDSLHVRPVFLWVPSPLNIAGFPSRGASLIETIPNIFSERSEVDCTRVIRRLYSR